VIDDAPHPRDRSPSIIRDATFTIFTSSVSPLCNHSAVRIQPSMASESIKKVQGKLFRGGSDDFDIHRPESLPKPGDRLTIDIPKPPSPPDQPPKMSKRLSDPPEGSSNDATIKSYRSRLAEALGIEYNGAEKFRLLQDGERKRHWKKWGPYLSDRQWVWQLVASQIPKPFDVFLQRLQSVRIIRQMVTPGVTSLMNTLGRVLTDGAKMVSLEFPTTISAFAFPLPFGTVKTVCLKSVSLESQDTKGTMAKM
jgi:hypothetical protein